MSALAQFDGLGAGGSGNNPAAGQLRRIGAFHRGTSQHQAAVDTYKALNEHTLGMHKEALSHESVLRKFEAQQAHEHELEKITHTSREQRRSATAAVKNHVSLVEGLKAAGVDPSAVGVTRINMQGIEIHTERPATPKPRATRSTAKPTTDSEQA